MKYKSELLSELIEKNGHATTKVPHYESECENEFISEVRGAYPKLIDYSGEWLNYANNHVNIGKFPTERVVDVTNARFENVVPYGYKSAILKGQTLVNVFNKTGYTSDNRPYLTLKGNFINVAPSELYTIKFFNAPISKVQQFRVVERHKPFVDMIYASFNDTFKFTTTNDFTNFEDLIIQVVETSSGIITDEELANIKVVLIKGDYTNVDIPYFEGMQSVKIPVLTTTGKNLFIGNYSDFSGGIYGMFKYGNTGEYYTISIHDKDTSVSLEGVWFGLSVKDNAINTLMWMVNQNEVVKNTFTTNDKDAFTIHPNNEETLNKILQRFNIQIESGTTATSYEPFKSNILTVNEEIELRGIGDVQDTLDCLTGEVTERIGEIVLDGSDDEKYSINGGTTSGGLTRFLVNNISNRKQKGNIISNLLPIADNSNSYGLFNGIGLNIVINCSTVDELKIWLQQNPITIQYQLETESVKTVYLSCLDENNTPTKFKPYEGVMYVVTSSETLPPLLDMEVPVEAINQNLAGFIK